MRRRRLIYAVVAIALVPAAFVYWVATAEAASDLFVAPAWDNHPHFLVGFGLRFPSEVYSRLVRIKEATYIDEGGRFVQQNVWVDEDPDVIGTSAHESTLSGLCAIDDYCPGGRESTTFMFKLKDNAYVESSTTPLTLPTGYYRVRIRYRVLWFERIVTVTRTDSPRIP